MEVILAGIIGGVIVLIGMKFAPKKSILKLFLKMFLVIKDYLLSAMGENLERFKDLFAESKDEYEREKKAEREVHMD
ncbi:MAG: hypothetical protein ISS66_17245 [Desulfobacteraceae bacterium]|nr:hypothetical protein [Desulfobacteraceae bacterium]